MVRMLIGWAVVMVVVVFCGGNGGVLVMVRKCIVDHGGV